MTVPNVLATRYASAEMRAIWSPENKIVLERRLWLAVLGAQRALGVSVPDGAIAVRSSTIGASDGYLDAWNRDKWPRPRLRSSRR